MAMALRRSDRERRLDIFDDLEMCEALSAIERGSLNFILSSAEALDSRKTSYLDGRRICEGYTEQRRVNWYWRRGC